MTETELELLKFSGMIILAFIGIIGAIFKWIAKPYFDSRIENIKTDNQIKIDKIVREFSQKDKSYNELKILYIKIHEMFEEAIKATQKYDTSNLNSEFSKLTAEVQMIASNEVIEKYLVVADLYDDWSTLYIKAYPKSINGYTIMYSKSADPTLQYKEPERSAYNKFYDEYKCLTEYLRSELANNI